MEKQFSIRPFRDADTERLCKWLYLDHVAKWYEHPMDWIEEINKRDQEYSWIHHYIAEYGKIPIGFCQYYEYCKGGEAWHGNIDTEGVYSIDYMIGESEFIGKGLGKEIITALIQEIAQRENARLVIVQPDPNNKASCGALLSAGFEYDSINQVYFFKYL